MVFGEIALLLIQPSVSGIYKHLICLVVPPIALVRNDEQYKWLITGYMKVSGADGLDFVLTLD